MNLPTLEDIRAKPKVLLHDHLDGGLHASTLIELADTTGYAGLPKQKPRQLELWIHDHANRKDMGLTLELFAHTVAVMQTQDAIMRVASECAKDLAADGVVYAEVRFAPELHCRKGLVVDDAIEAVVAGFQQGSQGTYLTIRAICSAMRNLRKSYSVAQAAVRWRDHGVVGFDLAGPEIDYPPDVHLGAFMYCKKQNFPITIHAGEVNEPQSIWKALRLCGANRIGHGIRIMDDISLSGDDTYTLGRLAHYVRDMRVPLEVCPTSNVCIGEVANIASHRSSGCRHLSELTRIAGFGFH